MSFASFYRLSSYTLIAAGFLALVATGEPGAVALTLFICAFAASCVLDTPLICRTLPEWAWQAMLFACLVYAWIDYAFLSHSVRQGVFLFLLLTAAVKLLSRTTDRDYTYLYLLSLGALLAAATITIELVYLACLILFLAAGISSLVLYEMNRSSTRALVGGRIRPVFVPRNLAGTGFELFVGFPAKSIVALTLSLTLAILFLAVPLFFLLPRVAVGSRHPGGRSVLLSGFSESVELGTLGRIKKSDALVMKVKVEAPSGVAAQGLRWRGMALDRFDGRSWSRNRSDRIRIPTQAGFFKLKQDAQGMDIIVQTFLLQPVATEVVFGSPRVLAVSGDLGWLERDTSDNIYALTPHTSAVSYSVVSDITRPDPRRFAPYTIPLPEDVSICCLQLPVEDPRVAALARTVTAEIRAPYEKALALEAFLRNNYLYSLDLTGTTNHPDPLSMFLFEVRRGHCEYFASALAVMLRELGIPARLVNGFRTGAQNALSRHWTVRQRDAHSWVEAWLPPYGWVEFDPTPAESTADSSAGLKVLAGLLDACDFWWTDKIVNYDLRSQSRLFRAGQGWFAGMRAATFQAMADAVRRLGGVRFSARAGVAVAVLSLLIMALTAASVLLPGRLRTQLLRYLCNLVRAQRGRDQGSLMTGCYGEALRILEGRGRPRKKSETPLEFAHSLPSEPFGTNFTCLTEIYYRVRFGRISQEDDLGRARELLRALRQ